MTYHPRGGSGKRPASSWRWRWRPVVYGDPFDDPCLLDGPTLGACRLVGNGQTGGDGAPEGDRLLFLGNRETTMKPRSLKKGERETHHRNRIISRSPIRTSKLQATASISTIVPNGVPVWPVSE